jgi:hypothetical protein
MSAAAAPARDRTRQTHAPKHNQIGDWGRLGNGDQRTAAKMMADVAGCMPPAFILSTGDNFYDRE